MHAKITGVGSYLPETKMTNHDLTKLVDTSHEWIMERSGIAVRHVASPNESVVTMGTAAALEALRTANVAPADVDLIIVATCTADYLFPSAACLIQQAIGAHKAAAFDIGAACSGFIYALTTANQFIQANTAKQVLVIGSEVMSRVLNWQDRATCVLFGDGAGAVLLSAADEPGIFAHQLYADGAEQAILYLPSGIHTSETAHIHMQGREVFRLAVDRLASAVTDIAEKAGITIADIDWIVPHQANARIINMIATKLKIPLDKIIITVDQHANTSSASIPLAFAAALAQGKIQQGDTILFEAFGGGLTWGSVLVKY